MEKTRVPAGEKFWYIVVDGTKVSVEFAYESEFFPDWQHFEFGNYFHTEEEAEHAAEKIRAIFNGADVIETPSEEEMKTKIKEISNKTISDAATSFLGYIDEMSSTFCEWAIEDMINYLKSKIIK